MQNAYVNLFTKGKPHRIITAMAQQGTPAFDPVSHAELLRLRAEGKGEIWLANHFETSLPTIRKWLRLPVGYQPKVGGRPKKVQTC